MQDNLHYVDDTVIMYPAGRTLVLHSTETKTQRFIQGTEGTEGLSALALSPSRKYVAVAERAEKGLITVYDMGTLKRRKVLSSSEMGSKVCSVFDWAAVRRLSLTADANAAGVRRHVVFGGRKAHHRSGRGS